MPIRWQCPTAVTTRVYTAKSDTYSFGVLLFEIYSGGLTPYANLATTEIVSAVQAGERLARPGPDTPEDIIHLMRACTTLETAVRPSMASVHAKLAGAWTLIDTSTGALAMGGQGSPGCHAGYAANPLALDLGLDDHEESAL